MHSQVAQVDRVSFAAGSPQPSPDEIEIVSLVQTIRATVSYVLQATEQGSLVLQVLDRAEGGRVIAASRPEAVSRTTDAGSTATLVLPLESAVVNLDEFHVKVILQSSALRTVAETAAVRYESFSEVSISSIEAVQAVQDAGNAVPLVAGKPLVVRVFARQSGPNRRPVRLAGSVTAQLEDRSSANVVLLEDFTDAQTNPSRDLAEHSLRFLVPGDYLADMPADTANLTIEASIRSADPARRARLRESTRRLTLPVRRSVTASDAWRIGYARVCVARVGQPLCPGRNLTDRHDFLARLLPADTFAVRYQPLPIPELVWNQALSGGDSDRFQKRLLAGELSRIFREYNRGRTGFEHIDMLSAWLPVLPDLPYAGLSDPPQYRGRGRVFAHQDGPEPASLVLFAHEAGHNLGLFHPRPQTQTAGPALHPCVALGDPVSNWIYDRPTIQEPGVDATADRLLPRDFFDIMSLCPEAQRWISPFHYQQLLRQLDRIRSDPQRRPVPPDVLDVPLGEDARRTGEWVTIAGWIARDANEGTLRPIERFTGEAIPDQSETSAPVCLVFLKEGQRVAEHCFPVVFADADGALSRQVFEQTVPWPEGTDRIVLRKEQTEVTSLSGGAKPQVMISEPQAGASVEGRLKIAWSATRSSDAPVVYRVYVSGSREGMWNPIAFETDQTELEVDTAQMDAEFSVRVVAMAGLDSAEAVAGPVRVGQRPRLELSSTNVTFSPVRRSGRIERSIVLRNMGTGPVTISSIETPGTTFPIIAPAPPFRVPASAERNLRLGFAPLEPGPLSATLIVNSDSEPRTTAVKVDGFGLASAEPSLRLDRDFFEFGTVQVNQPRDAVLQVTNYGVAPLEVSSVTPDASIFRVVNVTLPLVIPSTQSRTVTVQLTPAAVGALSGILRIRTNDPRRTMVELPMYGIGSSVPTTPPPPPGPPSPTPSISLLAPAFATAGSPGFVLSVRGSNFVSNSVAEWNGSPRQTTVLSQTVLNVAIASSDIETPGTPVVTVFNPPPGGGRSAPFVFRVDPSAPTPPVTPPAGPGIFLQQTDASSCPQIRTLFSLLDTSLNPFPRILPQNLSCSVDSRPVRCSVETDLEDPVSVVIVLGVNGTGGDDETAAKAAAKTLVQELRSVDRAAVIHLENTANPIRPFTSDKALLVATIDSLRNVGGGNALYEAISLAAQLLVSEGNRRRLVLVLSPADNAGGLLQSPATALARAAAANAPFFSIAYGPGMQSNGLFTFLAQLANQTQALVYRRESVGMVTTATQILNIIRNQAALTYVPPREGAAHTVTVQYSTSPNNLTRSRAIAACP
jgi:hypothetical protein